MNFIDKLEKKIGKAAIPHLMLWLIGMYIVGFILNIINPQFYIQHLSLDMYQIIHNLQLWRLISFLCYPPDSNPLWFLLLSFIYFSLGNTLEKIWGTFRFNLYIFLGVFGVILASLIIYLVSGKVYLLTADKLYLSMLLGIAATFPDITFMLYFIIPIKAKWLGFLYGGFLVYQVISSAIAGVWESVIAIVLSLLNFLVFFVFLRKKGSGSFAYSQRTRRTFNADRMRQSAAASSAAGARTPRHRCCVCGITDLDAPEMEFRFCSKCSGAREYCSNHLYTHTHIL